MKFTQKKNEAAPAASGTTSGTSTTNNDTPSEATMQGLKAYRIQHGIQAQEIVSVLREIYPGYDKTIQSKVENSDKYGISLTPAAKKAIRQKFSPNDHHGQHRLTKRISARLTDSKYQDLMNAIDIDGFVTVQEWLTYIVDDYLRRPK